MRYRLLMVTQGNGRRFPSVKAQTGAIAVVPQPRVNSHLQRARGGDRRNIAPVLYRSQQRPSR